PRCDGLADPVRPSGCDKYGIELASDSNQGNDAALSILRWILIARTWAGHGDDARADPSATRGKRDVSVSFVLAAGGTGGHLFPAQALASELAACGIRVHLASDGRADSIG